MKQNEEHLRVLSIFHYVVGGLAGLFSLIPLIHLAMGLFFVFGFDRTGGRVDAPPALMGWMIVALAGMFIGLGLTFAAFVLVTGRCLARRVRYRFCLIMAGVECIFIPFGTVLGVFTILVLMREEVKAMFERSGELGSVDGA